MSNDFYIVLSFAPEEIKTVEEAERVRANLERHVPDKVHRVYRCKRWLQTAHHFPKAVELLADIRREGLTGENANRLAVLLTTIGYRNRSEKTPHLQRRNLPEFDARARKA